jgi:HEAT repeat protein
LEGLKDQNASIRKTAARGLDVLGPEAKTAVSDLIAALRDEDTLVRCSVLRPLGKIGPEAKAAVPHIAALRKENPKEKLERYEAGAVAEALEGIQGNHSKGSSDKAGN